MESQVSSMRRPCFREDDDGLASIAGFSGVNHGYPINNNNTINNMNQPFVYPYNNNNTNNNGNIMMRRRNSLRNITSLSSSLSSSNSNVFSPRSTRLFDEIHSPHFLEACALCNKPLGGNRDIFMYRGDTPFCSEECREEQIEIDEAKEKNRNYKALRSKKEAKKKSSNTSTTSTSSSPSKTQNYPFHTGTVAAA